MKIYLVGGAVRDQLLDYPVTERDWVVVGATGQEMLDAGYRQVGRDFPVFLHPDTAEEYALARTERKSGRGHTGFSCNSDPTVTLEEDLSRRDLTVNAMARDTDGTIIDPYGGQADLQQRLLRHVSDAFVEDPLRVLRVARFAARYHHLGFKVAPATLEMMRSIAEQGELQLLPLERVWGELERVLHAGEPVEFFRVLDACSASQQLLPELAAQELALQQLELASATEAGAEILFAVLLETLPAADAASLCERLQPPRRFRDLALLSNQHSSSYQRALSLDAQELLQLLEKTDALRRTERFEQFLQVCATAHPDRAANSDFLRQCVARCSEVSVKAWAQSGMSGKELGEKIREERRQRLEQLRQPS